VLDLCTYFVYLPYIRASWIGFLMIQNFIPQTFNRAKSYCREHLP
jgi:hypothetical protein